VSASDTYEKNITFYLYNSTLANVNSTTYTDETHNINFTNLVDDIYYYNVTIRDWAENTNSTDTYLIRIDDTAPVVTIVSPNNETIYYSASMDFNVSVYENLIGIEECWFSLDGEANVSMTQFNSTYFNYPKSDMSHGYHNVTFWCNDSLNNVGTATEMDTNVVLLDLTVSAVTLPSIIYDNSTLIEINISNLAPPSASNVNVSCYYDGALFDSKLIDIGGNTYYMTNCTLDTVSEWNKLLNVTVDPDNLHPESNESNNEYTIYINVTQEGTLDAYDQEEDSDNRAGWLSEQETLPDQMTWFFANYTMDNSSTIITGATCNITFSGGSESGTYDLLYNESALLYYYNRTFDYSGNYSWITQCWKDGYEYLSGTGEVRIRVPIESQTSLGITTGLGTINYDEAVNLTAVVPTEDIDSSSSGYNLSSIWVQIDYPGSGSENVSLSGTASGGTWNTSYSHPGTLGTYSLTWFANLTNTFDIVRLVESNFSIENVTLTIALNQSLINVTDTTLVYGRARNYNGTDYIEVADITTYIWQDDVSNGTTTTNSTGYYNKSLQSLIAGNHTIKVNLTDDRGIAKEASINLDVNIPFRNASANGTTTGKPTVNHDETVNLTISIPSENVDSSNQLDSVWAQVNYPISGQENVSMSGSALGGLWNVNYTHPGTLGTYAITYFANLSDGFSYSESVGTTFSIENTSIIINAPSEVNTTQTIEVSGTINRYNGSDYVAVGDNLFQIKLNEVLTSSDEYNDTNFDAGTGTDVNVSSVVGLNLTTEGDEQSYSDDFSTTKYTSDAYNVSTNLIGRDGDRELIFSYDHLGVAVGSLTYEFNSITEFYDASVRFTTNESQDAGANTSVWYS